MRSSLSVDPTLLGATESRFWPWHRRPASTSTPKRSTVAPRDEAAPSIEQQRW